MVYPLAIRREFALVYPLAIRREFALVYPLAIRREFALVYPLAIRREFALVYPLAIRREFALVYSLATRRVCLSDIEQKIHKIDRYQSDYTLGIMLVCLLEIRCIVKHLNAFRRHASQTLCIY